MSPAERRHLPDTYAFFIPVGLDSSMHFMDEKRNASEIHSEERLQTPLHSGSAVLRRAMRRNVVSFPSQIPIFLKQPPADMQWRMVLLYFVRGWSSAKIAARFNVPAHWILKSLNGWSVRALALGYIQVIDPEGFATCCHADVEYGTNRDTEETRLAGVRPVLQSVPQPFPDAAPAMGAQLPVRPDGTRPSGPVDSPGNRLDLIAALDVAIAHCEEWRDEFWVRTATLLRDLRTVAVAALEVQRSSEQADGLFTAFQSGKNSLEPCMSVRAKESVSHAVA